MSGHRALVVGDAILDVWRDLEVTRASPEDPAVPVVVERAPPVTCPGGALKVAAELRAEGHRLAPASSWWVGYLDAHPRADLDRDRLRALLAGPAVRYVGRPSLHDAPAPLTRKVRVRVCGRVTHREDRDELAPAPEATRGALQAQLSGALPAARAGDTTALVAVDYGKGALSGALLLQLLTVTRPHLLVLDLKPALLVELLTGLAHAALRAACCRQVWAAVVKLNAVEAGVAEARLRELCAAEPDHLHRLVRRRLGADLVVTRSAAGAEFWPLDGAPELAVDRAPGGWPARCVVGAGDLFTGALTAHLLRGSALRAAVLAATARASQAARSGELAPGGAC